MTKKFGQAPSFGQNPKNSSRKLFPWCGVIENVRKMGFWRKLKQNTEKERCWWKEINPVWSEAAKLPLVPDKTRPLILVPVNLFCDQSSPSWPVLYAGTCLLMYFGTLEQETPIEDPRLVLSSAGTWKVKVSQKDQRHFRLASIERPFSATSAVWKQRFTCGLTPSVMNTITQSLKLRAVQRRISGKQNVVLRVGEWRAPTDRVFWQCSEKLRQSLSADLGFGRSFANNIMTSLLDNASGVL